MKYWTALCGLLLAAVITSGGPARWITSGMCFADSESGQSFVTQSNGTSSGREYDVNFGENWQSVRIFRLLEPLDKPLKIYIETNPKNQSLYRPNYRYYVQESLKVWDKALDGRLKYSYTTSKKDADISVEWVSGFSDRYVAGLTTYRVGHAAIEIKTVGVPEADIKGNIIHEFGHAFGISGHSNHPDDIMVGMRKWQRGGAPYYPKLSSRDVQAIKRLYSGSWKKGEDLYANAAQREVIEPIAAKQPPVKKADQAAITLQTAENTELIHWGEAQAKEAQDVKRFRYTQIFPKK